MSNSLSDLIKTRLDVLSPITLTINDESHLHVGHAGASGGASHFSVHIVAACFTGMRTIDRHRLVYGHLSDLMPFPIHALALKAYSPTEASA